MTEQEIKTLVAGLGMTEYLDKPINRDSAMRKYQEFRKYLIQCMRIGKPWQGVYLAATADDAIRHFRGDCSPNFIDSDVTATDIGEADAGEIVGSGESITINGVSTPVPYRALAFHFGHEGKRGEFSGNERWIYDENELGELLRNEPQNLLTVEEGLAHRMAQEASLSLRDNYRDLLADARMALQENWKLTAPEFVSRVMAARANNQPRKQT